MAVGGGGRGRVIVDFVGGFDFISIITLLLPIQTHFLLLLHDLALLRLLGCRILREELVVEGLVHREAVVGVQDEEFVDEVVERFRVLVVGLLYEVLGDSAGLRLLWTEFAPEFELRNPRPRGL